MTSAVALYLVILGAILIRQVLLEHLRGEVELLSVRNIFILGVLYFQIWGPIYPLITGNTNVYVISNLPRAAFIYALILTAALAVFWITYRRGPVVRTLAHQAPAPPIALPESVLWGLAFGLPLVAVLLKFGVQVPLVGILGNYAGNSFAALGMAIAAWLWATRMRSPMAAAMTGAVFVAASLIAMVGTFGRRELVGVGLALFWGMYYSTWRHEPLRRWAPRAAVLAVIPLCVFLVFTSVRSLLDVRDLSSLTQTAQQEGSIARGLVLNSIPDTGSVSLWLIDTHPRDFEQKPLFSLIYAVVHPIPREWWPEKPLGLGLEITSLARLRHVSRDMNIGPGLVGHIIVEGGWYALIVYSVILALLIRLVDEITRVSWWNPVMVAAMGSTLGQVLGTPRGELGLFSWIFVFGTLSSYVAAVVILKGAQSLGFGHVIVPPVAGATLDDDEWADTGHEDGWDDSSYDQY